jgi:hypothetical protein
MKFSPNYEDVYITGIFIVFTFKKVHSYGICTGAPAY